MQHHNFGGTFDLVSARMFSTVILESYSLYHRAIWIAIIDFTCTFTNESFISRMI